MNRFQKRIAHLLRNIKLGGDKFCNRPKRMDDRTVICNNCVGAMVLHDFGLKFCSPFVNLFIEPEDYILLLQNLKFFLSESCPLDNITRDNDYPVGLLGQRIRINFMHYNSFQEAKLKWYSRIKRIDWDNLYVIFVQQDKCTKEHLRIFDKMEFPHKISLVNYVPESNSQREIKGFENRPTLGHITDFSNIFGRRFYDDIDWKDFLQIQ